MRKLTLLPLTTLAALSLLALALPGRATSVGSPVPKPTAAGQTLISGVTAPWPYTLAYVPYSVTGTPTDLTTTFPGPVNVSPTGTVENGLTVNMPSAATGYVLKGDVPSASRINSSAPNFFLLPNGTANFGGVGTSFANGPNVPGINVSVPAGTLISRQYMMGSDLGLFPVVGSNDVIEAYNGITIDANTNVVPESYSPSAPAGVGAYHLGVRGRVPSIPIVVLFAASGQTADLADFNTSTGVKSASIDKSFNANFLGYSQALRTVTANDTATLSDSLLLINGAFNETLPTTGVPTGRAYTVKFLAAGGSLTNTIDGTAGFTASAANQVVQVVWSGSAYYKVN